MTDMIRVCSNFIEPEYLWSILVRMQSQTTPESGGSFLTHVFDRRRLLEPTVLHGKLTFGGPFEDSGVEP